MASTPDLSTRGQSRRRFTRAGIAAAGAISTVANATNTVKKCATASGSLSGGMSSHTPVIAPKCGGLSPGYWKNHGGWPCSTTKKFSDFFPLTNLTSVYANLTMMQVLNPQTFPINGKSDTAGIGRHMVATYLNIISSPTKINVLTTGSLLSMWNDYAADGIYKPSAAANWDAAKIVAYLQTTMT